MAEQYQTAFDAIPIDDYLSLRPLVGLSPKSYHGAQIGLPNTFLSVVVRSGNSVIGMGRVIGDGGLFFQVTDIAVHPDHQGRGVGKSIVKRLIERLDEIAPDGAYASLIADGDARHLYSKFGFVPTAPASVGMARNVGGRVE